MQVGFRAEHGRVALEDGSRFRIGVVRGECRDRSPNFVVSGDKLVDDADQIAGGFGDVDCDTAGAGAIDGQIDIRQHIVKSVARRGNQRAAVAADLQQRVLRSDGFGE